MNILKTKSPVLIDPIKMTQEIVYITAQSMCFDGYVYDVTVLYSTKDEDGTDVLLKEDRIKFTTQEVTAMEGLLGVVGDNLSEKLIDILSKGTLFVLGENGIFGLTSDDFEAHNEI